MSSYPLRYGNTHLDIDLPASFHVELIAPQQVEPLADIDQALRAILEAPLGELNWSHFSEAKSIGIAINDKTRPTSQPNPVNHLLDYLGELGIAKDKITLFISSGTHTPMAKEEWRLILDEDILAEYRVVAHDCDRSPMTALGKTSYGTPILVNQRYYDCDCKLTVGNIEPHHFMGFSGGVKTAAIGLASRETINQNHAMLKRGQTRSGAYHTNPMRQDIEEIGSKMGVHFCLSTILDEQKRIMRVFFGDPRYVMQAAIPFVRQVFGAQVPAPYDLVIASPGGAPKDINLYQAQKGLTHAARIAKDDAWVILLAACPEGAGSAAYEDYVTRMPSHQAVLDDFNAGFFQVGPHKAFQIARDAVRVKVVLVSEMAPEKVNALKITPSQPDKLEPLFQWIATQLPADARVAIMPAATRTMAEVTHVKS